MQTQFIVFILKILLTKVHFKLFEKFVVDAQMIFKQMNK